VITPILYYVAENVRPSLKCDVESYKVANRIPRYCTFSRFNEDKSRVVNEQIQRTEHKKTSVEQNISTTFLNLKKKFDSISQLDIAITSLRRKSSMTIAFCKIYE
jgi:hypothetical protein